MLGRVRFEFTEVRREVVGGFMNVLAVWTNPEGTQCKGVSFRKGGASSLASVNTPDRVIQIVGRWKSGVYRQYIHESAHDLASYFRKLEPNST